MTKKILFTLLFLFAAAGVFAQSSVSASSIYEESLKQSNVQETILFLQDHLESSSRLDDKRSLLYVLGTIQEQMGFYADASLSYAKAAGIAASDAPSMPKVSSEQLVLNAVRCSLCAGNFETADNYLNSAVRSSKNERIKATVNLYSAWSSLCASSSIEETEDTLALLKAYASMDSMKAVRPSVLLTLWYLTDDEASGSKLLKEYPYSPEAGIVKGNVQIMSVPFWYFVPRKEHSDAPLPQGASVSASSSEKTENIKITRQQLGLFKDKDNASSLVSRLKEKNFNAYILTETRSSGTTYYIVVVDENKEGTMGLMLRDAGFECYPVVDK